MPWIALSHTWEMELDLWGWIAELKKSGDLRSVKLLKKIWFYDHGFHKDEEIYNNCFFCDYVKQRSQNSCFSCPAAMVDWHFHCTNAAYHYELKPIEYYEKIQHIHEQYLAPLTP